MKTTIIMGAWRISSRPCASIAAGSAAVHAMSISLDRMKSNPNANKSSVQIGKCDKCDKYRLTIRIRNKHDAALQLNIVLFDTRHAHPHKRCLFIDAKRANRVPNMVHACTSYAANCIFITHSAHDIWAPPDKIQLWRFSLTQCLSDV